MSTIYVIIGTTGGYSDRDEWLVKAANSEDRAKELVLELSEPVRGSESWKDSQCEAFEHPLDPQCYINPWTGVSYSYKAVELEGK